MKNYDDIISLEHHVSNKHPQMARANRAAQFAPFAALNGYDDAVEETARLTDNKRELDEEMMAIINERLNIIDRHISQKPHVKLTYFVLDKKKNGGTYISVMGNVRQIDLINNIIILTNKKKIRISDLINISIE